MRKYWSLNGLQKWCSLVSAWIWPMRLDKNGAQVPGTDSHLHVSTGAEGGPCPLGGCRSRQGSVPHLNCLETALVVHTLVALDSRTQIELLVHTEDATRVCPPILGQKIIWTSQGVLEFHSQGCFINPLIAVTHGATITSSCLGLGKLRQTLLLLLVSCLVSVTSSFG